MTDRHDTDVREVEARDRETRDVEARDAATRGTDIREVEAREIETRDREARDVETSGTDVRDIDARAVEPDASPTHANNAQPEPPKQRSKFFDPDLKIVDHDNFLNRLYDAPDEEWARWRMSADGRTRYRI